mmetsp:Transcript_769/g.2043  ORF Transcript_769/g.2043 Transcript_769/m.2043 type:complete len:251 (-) Transcript_769:727-1479(-)
MGILFSVVEHPTPLLRLGLCVLLFDGSCPYQPQIRCVFAHKRHVLCRDMICRFSQLLEHHAHMRKDHGALCSGFVLVQRLELDIAFCVRMHVRQAARQWQPPRALSLDKHLEATNKDPKSFVATAVVRCLVVAKEARHFRRHLEGSQHMPRLRLCLTEVLLIKCWRQLHFIQSALECILLRRRLRGQASVCALPGLHRLDENHKARNMRVSLGHTFHTCSIHPATRCLLLLQVYNVRMRDSVEVKLSSKS